MGAIDVRPPDCATCDRAATRSAALLVQLRKTAQRLHVVLGHRGHWMDCLEEPCRNAAAAART